MDLERTTVDDPGFLHLVSLLDQRLRELDGEEHAFYAQYNKPKDLNVVVARIDGEAVGCGAFKRIDDHTAEIKRMYVSVTHRRKGIARQVLSELETWVKEEGYSKCILETGKKQFEAIALYQQSGYTVIPNYGQYAGVENSVCMQKKFRVPGLIRYSVFSNYFLFKLMPGS